MGDLLIYESNSIDILKLYTKLVWFQVINYPSTHTRIKHWCASSNPPFVLSEISLSGQPEVLQE